MVRIAIIGNNSVGKSTFIDYMKLYGTENCTYHEFSFDSDCNMKFDSYVYLLDCAQNINSIKEQLARINTDITLYIPKESQFIASFIKRLQIYLSPLYLYYWRRPRSSLLFLL